MPDGRGGMELGWVESMPGAAVSLGRHPKQREVTAFIPVVKKFMKTCPVTEVAGVQPGPCQCSHW